MAPWYVVIEGALIIELSPNVDLWFCMDKFRWLPTLTYKNNGQEDIDFQWLWFWAGYTRRKPKHGSKVDTGETGRNLDGTGEMDSQ